MATPVARGRNLGIIHQVEKRQIAKEVLAVCVALAALSLVASTIVLVGSKLNPQRFLGQQVGTLGASLWCCGSVVSVVVFSLFLNHHHRKNHDQLNLLGNNLRQRPKKTLNRIRELEQYKTHEKELQERLEDQVKVDQRLREQGGKDEQEIALLELQLKEAKEELQKARKENLEKESTLKTKERTIKFKTNLFRSLLEKNGALETSLKENVAEIEKLEKDLRVEQLAKEEALARLPDWLQNDREVFENHYTESGLPTPTTFERTFEEFAPRISQRINIAEMHKLSEEMGAYTMEDLIKMIDRKYFKKDPGKLYFLNYEQIQSLTPELLNKLTWKEIGYIFFGYSLPAGNIEERVRFSKLSLECVHSLLERFKERGQTHFLEALSVQHIQKLDYSLIAPEHLDKIFPSDGKGNEKYGINKRRFAHIPGEKLDFLLSKKRLAPFCLDCISETQLHALKPSTMEKLSAAQVHVLFPKNASGKQRYSLLSESQKEGLRANELLAVKMIVHEFEGIAFTPYIDPETKELLSKMQAIVEEDELET